MSSLRLCSSNLTIFMALLFPKHTSLSVEEGLRSLDFCHCDKILKRSNFKEKRLALIQDFLGFSEVCRSVHLGYDEAERPDVNVACQSCLPHEAKKQN